VQTVQNAYLQCGCDFPPPANQFAELKGTIQPDYNV
jgi:hypothetical protein